MSAALAFAAGALFAVGLVLSGMTDPANVRAFLDVGGAWSPRLAGVMGGAVAVYFIADRVARRRARAWSGTPLPPRPATRIDGALVGGAALFGIGWGASGFCPGPALVSLGAATPAALYFVPAMLVGIALFRGLSPRVASAAPAERAAQAGSAERAAGAGSAGAPQTFS